jgi:hypothetical protein
LQSQKSNPGSQLPAPEVLEEWSEISAELKNVANVEAKGMLGGIMRTLKGFSKCVWIVNQQSEEITVVISRSTPTMTSARWASMPTQPGAASTFLERYVDVCLYID